MMNQKFHHGSLKRNKNDVKEKNENKDVLVTRDQNGRIRVLYLSLKWNDSLHAFIIDRQSGIYKGKLSQQPLITISKGKVKRTVEEQALLQYNSLIKKYLDKGYKKLSELGESDDLEKIVPKQVTDTVGIAKPMLCKVWDPNDKKNDGIEWMISKKHDGVRTFIYQRDGIIRTKSRGGQNYDIATYYICNDDYIKSIFEQYPDIILDGEIYHHTWPLSKISGLCRLENLHEDHKQLYFHCYDIADENKIFKDRLKLLQEFAKNRPTDSKLVIVDHYPVKTKEEMMKYHNMFIKDGYEGAVIRDTNQKYKFGARGRLMQKIKIFSDAEFKITGLSEGLRDEDMCFTLVTKEGYPFKAKPIGDRELKQWYRNHLNELIGKMATIKYFGMTTTNQPVPNLPILKSIRIEQDLD